LLNGPVKIKIAKTGELLTAKCVGEMHVKTTVDGTVTSQKSLLLVPGLEFNLLSVRKLEMNDFKIVFQNAMGTSLKGNKVIDTAYRKHKLHELTFFSESESANLCAVNENSELWYKHLGHISTRSLKELRGMVDAMNINSNDCVSQICVEGKQTKLPRVQEQVRSKRPL